MSTTTITRITAATAVIAALAIGAAGVPAHAADIYEVPSSWQYGPAAHGGIALQDAYLSAADAATYTTTVAVLDVGFSQSQLSKVNAVPGANLASWYRDNEGWQRFDTGIRNTDLTDVSPWSGQDLGDRVLALADTVNPRTQIRPVKIVGSLGAWTGDTADAIRWSAGYPVEGLLDASVRADVITLTIPSGSGTCPAAIQSAIDDANAVGSIVVIAAADTSVPVSDTRFGSCDGVITVAASTAAGVRTQHTNTGATIAAPSAGTESYYTAEGFSPIFKDGTSYSATLVSGTIALMRSIDPMLTREQVVSILTRTATRSSDAGLGAGVLNAGAALRDLTGIAPAKLRREASVSVTSKATTAKVTAAQRKAVTTAVDKSLAPERKRLAKKYHPAIAKSKKFARVKAKKGKAAYKKGVNKAVRKKVKRALKSKRARLVRSGVSAAAKRYTLSARVTSSQIRSGETGTLVVTVDGRQVSRTSGSFSLVSSVALGTYKPGKATVKVVFTPSSGAVYAPVSVSKTVTLKK